MVLLGGGGQAPIRDWTIKVLFYGLDLSRSIALSFGTERRMVVRGWELVELELLGSQVD